MSLEIKLIEQKTKNKVSNKIKTAFQNLKREIWEAINLGESYKNIVEQVKE